jgi:hypothetical protein
LAICISILVALVLGACTDPRKLVLSIDTTAGIPCDIDRVRIRATASQATTFERSLDRSHLPLSVTLLDDTMDGSFDVEIIGLKGDVAVMQVSGRLQFGDGETAQAVMLDPNCGGTMKCALSGAISAGSVSAPSIPRVQCGPGVLRYAATMTSADAADPCRILTAHTGKVLMNRERGPVALTDLEPLLPSFGFEFYGEPIHRIWVARDGYLSFGREPPDPKGDLTPGPLDRGIQRPGAAPPARSVMAFWDDLSPSSQGVCYELDGAPGSQKLRLAWTHACLTDPCGSDNLNFMITLDESNQQIVLSYGTMSATPMERAQGVTATVGLVHDATGCPVDQCVLATGLCMDGTTPCGYSQVSSSMAHPGGMPNMAFSPINAPR